MSKWNPKFRALSLEKDCDRGSDSSFITGDEDSSARSITFDYDSESISACSEDQDESNSVSSLDSFSSCKFEKMLKSFNNEKDWFTESEYFDCQEDVKDSVSMYETQLLSITQTSLTSPLTSNKAIDEVWRPIIVPCGVSRLTETNEIAIEIVPVDVTHDRFSPRQYHVLILIRPLVDEPCYVRKLGVSQTHNQQLLSSKPNSSHFDGPRSSPNPDCNPKFESCGSQLIDEVHFQATNFAHKIEGKVRDCSSIDSIFCW